MRRLVVLAIVALLGIFPISIVGRSASAQATPQSQEVTELIANCSPITGVKDAPPRPWEGICRPIAEDATIPAPLQQTVQPYAVPFKEEFAAALPIGDGTEDQPMAEFMVVYVKTGSFAIDLETDMQGDSQQVVVSTPHENIQTLEPWSADPPHYVWNHRYLTINGEICTRACPIDPDMPVLLMPGDFAVAEKGALCIYCLLNNNEGLLEVFVLLDAGLDSQDFSWIRDWDNSQATASASLPVNSEPMVMAWAFNPGTKCDH